MPADDPLASGPSQEALREFFDGLDKRLAIKKYDLCWEQHLWSIRDPLYSVLSTQSRNAANLENCKASLMLSEWDNASLSELHEHDQASPQRTHSTAPQHALLHRPCCGKDTLRSHAQTRLDVSTLRSWQASQQPALELWTRPWCIESLVSGSAFVAAPTQTGLCATRPRSPTRTHGRSECSRSRAERQSTWRQ